MSLLKGCLLDIRIHSDFYLLSFDRAKFNRVVAIVALPHEVLCTKSSSILIVETCGVDAKFGGDSWKGYQ